MRIATSDVTNVGFEVLDVDYLIVSKTFILWTKMGLLTNVKADDGLKTLVLSTFAH